jgi:hypothetical protein
MATLTTVPIAATGVNPGFTAAAAGGDKVTPGDRTFLHVKNGGGAPITVTITAVRLCSDGGLHNSVVSVTNGEDRVIGPVDSRFAAVADGLAAVTYSAVTSVTVAALRL